MQVLVNQILECFFLLDLLFVGCAARLPIALCALWFSQMLCALNFMTCKSSVICSSMGCAENYCQKASL